MNRESEAALENKLVEQLVALGYENIMVKDILDVEANLRVQLGKHNQTTFTDKEFKQILNHLNKGNIFEKAKTLRDKMQLTRDSGDKNWIEFLDIHKWCKNLFQVAQQITVEGKYKNRYDVTLLINGLPLVQIELKRRGLELKEAFNQIKRYQLHSYGGLFDYIQCFVISNGVNTKYYASNRNPEFKQTFFWSDVKNKNITQLEAFTNIFLEPCHISKMITQYTVLHETDKVLMVLRPYQCYAIETIINRVKDSDKNGYIWHTTGSGKTLTSFKASKILTILPDIKKVVFVVDRKDLDTKTISEFNQFKKGSVDGTENTRALVRQFADDDTKLIVTTIQKLNNAISHNRHQSVMRKLKDEKIILIFDECHRSQFGDTHARIKQHFNNTQMFGFTGTPIFAKNSIGQRTTKDLFDDQLHSYVITDAIRDENVLQFSVEYVGKYRHKDSRNEIDIEVEAIDVKELMESSQRAEKIVDYILDHHDRKTHSQEFTAMFCVSSIDALIRYYEIFKKKQAGSKHDLKIATIYSYRANEDLKQVDDLSEADGLVTTKPKKINVHARDKLEEFIAGYNQMFGTNYSTDSDRYYSYYKDIAKRVINQEVDILLVVNMFLTGFDSKYLNTLYVDKNLRYHGLIQAYSRTNRILNDKKSQGNIIVFRNLKKNTDEAVQLYSDKDAQEIIFRAPYEDQVQTFNQALAVLYAITPTVESVNALETEDDELEFVQSFREVIRLMNELVSSADFKFEDLKIDEQSFEDYKSKYLDIYDRVRTDKQKEQVSILNDVDFQTELTHRDDINVAYILKLVTKLKDTQDVEAAQKQRQQISELLSSDVELRSKRELIEKFIDSNLPKIESSDEVTEAFKTYWSKEEQKAFSQLCKVEGIDSDKLEKVITNFRWIEREPTSEEIAAMLNEQPKVLDTIRVVDRVKTKIMDLIDTFLTGGLAE